MSRIVCFVALEQEIDVSRFYQMTNLRNTRVDLIITGIGKLNAYSKALDIIGKTRYDLIINAGSGGGYNLEKKKVYISNRFFQWDIPQMLYSLSSFPKYIFEYFNEKFSNDQLVWTATGDTFMTEKKDPNFYQLPEGDDFFIVDMESYAIAKVADSYDIPFINLRYVTDVIGSNSIIDWQEELSECRIELTSHLLSLINFLSKKS